MDSHHGSGTLCSITGDIRNSSEEIISRVLLPPSLFEPLSDEVIGLFFLFYESASFFPVAGVPNITSSDIMTRIGSPVVAATVVTTNQTSFSDLREPVTIVLRLNPVQEGVRCTGLIAKYIKPYAFHLSHSIAEYYTLHMCVLGFQPCR